VEEERDPGLDIRRPELRGIRRNGTVRWWKPEKGYGRITADDGEVLFVHFSGIEGEGYRELKQGERVSFVSSEDSVSDHGRFVADEVRIESE
jgi:CspA family cold shock protein